MVSDNEILEQVRHSEHLDCNMCCERDSYVNLIRNRPQQLNLWFYEEHTSKEMPKANLTQILYSTSHTFASIWIRMLDVKERTNEKNKDVRNAQDTK